MTRNHEIKVRFNDDEFHELCLKVDQSNLSRERFIRACIHNCKIVEPPDLNYFQLINEFNSIGNNLNQIARAVNANGYLNPNTLSATLDELRGLVKSLNQKVRG